MADTTRVNFTRPAAERIAAVVRTVEKGDRDQAALKFDKPLDQGSGGGSAIRLGTFTGAWAKGETKTVTLFNSTATASVKNVSVPIDASSASSRTVLFSKVSGTYHAVEIEQGGLCGSWKDYLVTMSVANCLGSGASAVVRTVDATATEANSGTGAITLIEMLTYGEGYAKLGRLEPTVGVSAASTNVTISISLNEYTQNCGEQYWSIGGATASGNTTYWTPQTLSIHPGAGVTEETPAVLLLSTAGVSITSGGVYFEESTEASPYTSTPTVTVSQKSPSSGGGAVLTPVIETDPTSTAFGQCTSITISSGGTGYMAWMWTGSIPVGNIDLASFTGFKAYKTQILGHENSCLKWFDITTCGTSTATP